MILPDTKSHVGDSDLKGSPKTAEAPEDSPPEYTPPSAGPSTAPAFSHSASLPADVQPTNFLSLSRTSNSIKDTWVIDPTLSIPAAFLPPLDDKETRKNAKIESTHGSVHVNVWVAPSTAPPEGVMKQTTLYFKSQHGSVRAKVYRTDDRSPVSITAIAGYSSITLCLPRSFCGPVTLSTTYGSTKTSDAVGARMTTFSETNGTRRAFVGDYKSSGWMANPDGWQGDELVVDAKHGSIKLSFLDDGVGGSAAGQSAGFWSKLFGGA